MARPITALWIAMLALGPATAHAGERVGLSVRFDNGTAPQTTVYGNQKRFINELDIIATANTAADEGIDPLIDDGDLAGLDWSGVEVADEEWRPDGMGGFTRQRFYRNAAWMEQPSLFLVFQRDASGKFLPELPFIVYAGIDDLWSTVDGGFIRRFNARQITTGCAAVGDCSTATGYQAQGLVQLRESQHPHPESRKIRQDTASLWFFWSADPLNVRELPVQRLAQSEAEYANGFDVDFDVVTPPSNGQFYLPGDTITFELHFTDGEGNPLDDDGMLPTFADFIDGGTESGLRYFDVLLNPTLYYALKHREGNIIFTMAGPSDALRVTDYTIPAAAFFGPQIQAAFQAEHGFSAVATGVPPFFISFGGLFDPTVWNAPVSTQVSLTLPADAAPGTYVVTTKARRDYGGEAVNDAVVHRIQVGTSELTEWEPTTTGCNECHTGQTALSEILHGTGDRESCLAGCHTSLEVEPDAALDYRVHFVHTRSDRYPADPDDCLVCHVEEPEGIPRGYPGFVFPFE